MLAIKIDLLLKKFEGHSQDKAQMQTLQALETRMTCEVCGNVGHSGDNCLETQEEALYLNGNNNGFRPQGGQGWNQPRPNYQGGNIQPTLRDLFYGQAKINESLKKKLAATDKSMETIHAKMDGFSITIKNQLSFNKMLKTQLAQLDAATPSAELGNIPGQPESTLQSVNVINAMWKEPLSRTPLNYAEKLTHPKEVCGANWQLQYEKILETQ